ncbi:MAG: phosphatidate cytidylyltransferase [Chitinophagaceae bacterium]|nr:phosphatidate cytidylyltransferase [Chitinophagaceae bacterium]
MPFDVKTFRTRTLTAVIFAIVMLVGLLWNGWSFALLFIIIHFGCWYEFVKLMKKIFPQKYFYFIPLGLVYITLPVLMMMDLRFTPVTRFQELNALIIPCAIVFSIWINDTMAYIAGSFIGKTPFSKISPKKTWEGTIGGALLCVFVMTIIAVSTKTLSIKDAIAIAAICALFGTAGDLLESKLKRQAGVKDSGNFMPGHGGFLDRFDSFLIAVPFVWIYVFFFMR